MIGED